MQSAYQRDVSCVYLACIVNVSAPPKVRVYRVCIGSVSGVYRGVSHTRCNDVSHVYPLCILCVPMRISRVSYAYPMRIPCVSYAYPPMCILCVSYVYPMCIGCVSGCIRVYPERIAPSNPLRPSPSQHLSSPAPAPAPAPAPPPAPPPHPSWQAWQPWQHWEHLWEHHLPEG